MIPTQDAKSDDWEVIEGALKQFEKKGNKMGALSAGELLLSLAEVIKAMPERKFNMAMSEVQQSRQAREQAAKTAAPPQQSDGDKAILAAFKARRQARRQGLGTYVRQ